MRYDFIHVPERRHTDSIKWDIGEKELPMWIADMDFLVAPEFQEAFIRRIKEGSFGYVQPQDTWYDAYISFFQDRYGLTINKDWLLFSQGVVPTISSSVRKLTKEGDNVVVLSPVYNIFYNSIVNNNRVVYQVPLLYENYQYSIDWDGLEKAFALEKTTLFILCNPANPVSKIWTQEELAKIGALARKYNVIVLSDEIHGPITRPGTEYVPYLSASEENKKGSVICVSPTKAFNIASIHTSAVIVPEEELRKKVDRQLNTDEVAEPNAFACLAAETAFNEGRLWLDEMRKVVFQNRDYVKNFLSKYLTDLVLVDGDATYLLWIDCSKLTDDGDKFVSFLKEKTGLIVSEGSEYGGNGKHFLRLNVACPQSQLDDALARLTKGVSLYKEEK